MDNYFEAKAILFQNCKSAVINLDDEYSDKFIERCKCPVYTYSAKSNTATYTAESIIYKADSVSYALVADGNIGKIQEAVLVIHKVEIVFIHSGCLVAEQGDFKHALFVFVTNLFGCRIKHLYRSVPVRIGISVSVVFHLPIITTVSSLSRKS